MLYYFFVSKTHLQVSYFINSTNGLFDQYFLFIELNVFHSIKY